MLTDIKQSKIVVTISSDNDESFVECQTSRHPTKGVSVDPMSVYVPSVRAGTQKRKFIYLIVLIKFLFVFDFSEIGLFTTLWLTS